MTQDQIKDRPKAGCSRCFWWLEYPHLEDGWGQCALNGEPTWFKHAPCSEYELQTIESCGTLR